MTKGKWERELGKKCGPRPNKESSFFYKRSSLSGKRHNLSSFLEKKKRRESFHGSLSALFYSILLPLHYCSQVSSHEFSTCTLASWAKIRPWFSAASVKNLQPSSISQMCLSWGAPSCKIWPHLGPQASPWLCLALAMLYTCFYSHYQPLNIVALQITLIHQASPLFVCVWAPSYQFWAHLALGLFPHAMPCLGQALNMA